MDDDISVNPGRDCGSGDKESSLHQLFGGLEVPVFVFDTDHSVIADVIKPAEERLPIDLAIQV
jgi:hypothetical protein